MRPAVFLAFLLVVGGCAQNTPLDSAALERLFEQGAAAKRNNDLATAERLFRSALDSAAAAGNPTWQGRFEQSLGDLLLSQGQAKEAGGAYVRALEWFEKAGAGSDANTLLLRLGGFYANLGDFPEAIDYLKRAIAGFLTAGDQIGRANALDLVGQIEARRSHFDEAGLALGQALNLYESAANPQRVAKIRGSLADLYRRKADFRQALEIGFLALDGDEKSGDRRETAKVLDVLGNRTNCVVTTICAT